MKTYRAPWSTSLVIISSLGTALCLGIAVGVAWHSGGRPQWIVLAPIAIICGGALFGIRGYTVTPEAILVHRLLWTTRLPLGGLQTAQFEPNAMRRSIRMFGNSGLFSFSGWFRNTTLGTYRAFVTDPQRTVILHFPAKTVLVSPSSPEEFVNEIRVAGQATG